MESYLFEREVIRWSCESGSPLIERVIWTDDTLAFTFDISAKNGFPEPRRVSDILDALATGTAERIPDPWARIIRDEDLNDREREVRDKAWGIVHALAINEPEIYDRKKRGQLVRQFVQSYNDGKQQNKLDIKTVHDYLRRYWQRGKTINALVPDYANSSGKGTSRKPGTAKMGRPRQFKDDKDVGEGVNVSEDDKRIFRSALIRHYLTTKENSMETVYELMVAESYAQQSYYDESGEKHTEIRPKNQIPTIHQLRRFYYNHLFPDKKKVISARQGSKHFALNHRAVTGSSKAETRGAGSRFQIDATVLDIYICSKFNRVWIIGRPVLYVVIDVFSEMIVGLYVGLEGPSWTGAMMALMNCAEDKVEFCRRYGREIAPEEWPCHHLPSTILADRGELVRSPIEQRYIPNLHVAIENAPSGRPDFKGLIEGCFPKFHKHTKPFTSGFVNPRYRQQGKRDYRFDGDIDLDQITEMAIEIVLYYNNKHPLDNYERDEEMIAANVPKIPREIWNWSLTRRSGGLRPVKDDLNFVKYCLLPTFPVTITESGLKLKLRNLPIYNINHSVDLYYTCEKAYKEQWFEQVRSSSMPKTKRNLIGCLDLRAPEMLYLPNGDNKTFEPCDLIDVEERYHSKHFEDIICLFAHEKLDRQRYQGTDLQAKVDLNTRLAQIASQGKEMTRAALDATPTSGHKRIASMGDKRAIERQIRHGEQAFKSLQSKPQFANSELTETPESSPEASIASDGLELLRETSDAPLQSKETEVAQTSTDSSKPSMDSDVSEPLQLDQLSDLELLWEIQKGENRGRS